MSSSPRTASAPRADFIGDPANRGRERPYGWGWALQLIWDVQTRDDPEAARWMANLEPLARAVSANFLEWLPRATYPIRYGVHGNSAFGVSRSLPFARSNSPLLLDALLDKARIWFDADADYPAAWEPSGADFLSPALCEAELMAQIAHLHGLNLSRAWCWRRIAESLPPDDARVPVTLQAMQDHAAAALPHVTGDDDMVDHWLAADAVLLMT